MAVRRPQRTGLRCRARGHRADGERTCGIVPLARRLTWVKGYVLLMFPERIHA
jgi:hypothetical protein